MTTIDRRTWSIGYQVTAGPAVFQPAHEETVGPNWYEAVDRLHALVSEWARNSDSGLPDLRPAVWDQFTAAWEANPPSYPHDASFELTGPEGVEIRFYLTGEAP